MIKKRAIKKKGSKLKHKISFFFIEGWKWKEKNEFDVWLKDEIKNKNQFNKRNKQIIKRMMIKIEIRNTIFFLLKVKLKWKINLTKCTISFKRMMTKLKKIYDTLGLNGEIENK